MQHQNDKKKKITSKPEYILIFLGILCLVLFQVSILEQRSCEVIILHLHFLLFCSVHATHNEVFLFFPVSFSSLESRI